MCGVVDEIDIAGMYVLPGPSGPGERFSGYFTNVTDIVSIELKNYTTYFPTDGFSAGGSVYTQTNVGDRTFAQLVGHVVEYACGDNTCKSQYLYYSPVDKVIDIISAKYKCNYVPLVYNENNAQEYDQLIAQVEIPTKK